MLIRLPAPFLNGWEKNQKKDGVSWCENYEIQISLSIIKFIGAQPCPFVSILPALAFVVQCQSRLVVVETMYGRQNLKHLLLCPLQKKFANSHSSIFSTLKIFSYFLAFVVSVEKLAVSFTVLPLKSLHLFFFLGFQQFYYDVPKCGFLYIYSSWD